MSRKYVLVVLVAAVIWFFFLPGMEPMAWTRGEGAMKLSSPAFRNGGMIPGKYACDGRDISPPLSWERSPRGTAGFALICDDPDAPAGTWVHWVYYDIPADTRELPEDVPPRVTPPAGGKQGTNDFGRIGYGGPCPPAGTHRYFFRLYALDTVLDLDPGLTKGELLGKIQGHILGQAQLMGKYSRR